MAPATIKDLAKTLNLSPSTVSRALRDHPDISHLTKKRVMSLAKKLDYHPDTIAQSLQTKKTKTIGVIVPEIKQPFFASVINGIEELVYASGYTIIVCQSNEIYDREVLYTRTLVSHRVAGLLVSLSQTTQSLDHFKMLQRRGIPIVFFDRVSNDIEASKVVVDDYKGALAAVDHLIRAGYKRIAHLAGPINLSISKYRLKGYKDALKQNNLPFKPELVVYGGLDETDGVIGFQKLLNLAILPDAVFAVNDPVAIGAFVTIKEHGLKIPGDIALVGFSNTNVSSLLEPPLTTVEQPSYEIGKIAAQLLMDQIQNNDETFVPKFKILKTHLIVRGST
ncbi:MAG: LacI family DNA-binding transcriptional regulator [Desulfobacterales bacterium]|nr:MAG: LacI family DNA-binding transcriptional regulator [Desulfobacterales bacterium]